jgi:GT2 family glycosyltransferase
MQLTADNGYDTAASVSGFRPTKILEFDLAEPLPDIAESATPDGVRYERILAFVRLHGEPLQLMEIDLADGALPAARLAAAIWPTVAERVRVHIARDGGVAPDELGVHGIQPPEGQEPLCLTERARFRESAPRITVLIPTRERPARLSRCLDSILASEFPIDRLTVIVVDNAPSTAATQELVADYRERADVRYVREDATGSASARNRGLEDVDTELVLMTDDDTVVDRHWITEVARTFATYPDAAVVSGLLVPMELNTPAQVWFEQWGGFSRGFERRIFDLDEHRPASEPLYPWTAGVFGTGNNFAFRTQAIRDIRGFDPALGNGTPALGGVDTEILLRTILTGHTIIYEPRAIVHHAHRVDYPALRRQIYGYGAGLVAVWLKTLLANPRLSTDFVRKIAPGVRFALSPRSAKNAKKQSDYPAELTRLELRGMLYGPLGYARSRRKYGPHRVPKTQVPRPAPSLRG